MSNDNNLKGLDLHSEEVQELMGAVPSWIQRWGISLIAIILAGTIILCNYIYLPQKTKITLSSRPSDNVVMISAPDEGRIKSMMIKNNEAVATGDTLFIYQSLTGHESFTTSPIDGVCLFTGPASTGDNLPGKIEILQIRKLDTESIPYYGYLPGEYHNVVHIGDSMLIDSGHTVRITFISPNPAAGGQYYFEISAPINPIQTSLTGILTVSNESIFQQITKQLRPKAVPLSEPT